MASNISVIGAPYTRPVWLLAAGLCETNNKNQAFVFQQQDYKQAERYSDAALTNDRYNPNALVNKGNVYYARGEYDKAREFYREAFANEASCVEALFNLGKLDILF